ncbi:nuclear ribonucleoprotein A2 homolog 1 [Octopus vulgaris]|uniref:Nuclear ribonucleoprotein A2 homolog 1 n=2 Tax=Octopus vulgaris TaxID=6645 RepID=A0AA36B1D2_OCTVU|nr:nuclear ribonucleoprotein A2 homolog 1 [Octopus vulgaris]
MPEKFGENEKNCKLFIGGLNFETTEDNLRNHFGKWGDVVDCVIMKDSTTHKSKGFGFVTFKDPVSLDMTQKERPHTIDGKVVDTKRAMPRDEAQENKVTVNKMFVGGLDESTSEEQVREVFCAYGEVEKIEMIKDRTTGKPKRFCFVTFDDHDCVDKCVIQKHFMLNGKNVEVKKAVSKNELNQNMRGGRGGMMGARGGGMRGAYSGGPYGGGQAWNYGGHQGYGDSYGASGYQGYGDSYDGYGHFGTAYGNGSGGGPTRGRGGGMYTQRGMGPYGGGYGGGANW